MARETPPPTPLPNAPTPAPAATAPPPPPVATPTPRPSTTPLPVAPLPSAPSATAPSRSPFDTGSGVGAPRGAGRSDGGPGFVPSARAPLGGGAEILSDTQGVNFDPYLRRILSDIKRNWEPLIPEEAQPPLYKQGETYIRFTILPDGNIKSASMHLDNSTHDIAIDKSCWSAIVSEGQFPPLPTQFHGPELELRIHFLVNKNIEY
jgi:outer membrane biosynthesis protein TonB